MKIIVNPNTFKLQNFSTSCELNYHFNGYQSSDSYTPTHKSTYQIASSQAVVGKVDVAITAGHVLTTLLEMVPDKRAFNNGYSIGFEDGVSCGSRKTFLEPQRVAWSFLVGYEYGVQLGSYYHQFKWSSKEYLYDLP